MANSKKARRKFSKEFKAEVVKLVLDGGRSVPDVCRQP
jgi:transposase-like protein